MQVTYTPEDGDKQTFHVNLNKIKASEAEKLEKAAELVFSEFFPSVVQGNVKALRALLWLCLRKDHPNLRLDNVPDFYYDEISIQADRDDYVGLLRQTERAPDSDQKTELIAEIKAEMAKLPNGPDGSGKALES